MYVPQRASLLPGTPRDFLAAVSGFSAHHHSSSSPSPASAARAMLPGAADGKRALSAHPAFAVADAWGVPRELWDRTWANLSGGEAQRAVLAIAVGMRSAEVLLLDGERCRGSGLEGGREC